MRKTLVFSSFFFVLALIFASSTYAVTEIQRINPEFQISTPTNTPTPAPTIALKIAPKVKGTFSAVTGTPTNTPTPTAKATNTLIPSPTPEVTLTVDDQEEPAVVGEIAEGKEEPKKLDQKETIGVILIGILIVIIVIQALWDKIKKPPTATSSDPE